MKSSTVIFSLWFVAAGFIFSPHAVHAQAKKKTTKTAKVRDNSPYAPGPLFSSDSLLELKLSGNLKEIFNDRDEENPQERPMLLQYETPKMQVVSIPVEVQSRGHFRRKRENCTMPPLWIDIQKGAKLSGTTFEKQNKLKLVTPCLGDEYVVREYLVYKLYNLLSPQCMRARLARVTFEDSAGKVKSQTKYCLLIEDDEKAARRNGYHIVEKMKVVKEAVNATEFTKTAVFEYLIGNTDWSVPYLHNIKLAYKDSTTVPIAIPYDFDHSGMVNAPYAVPPEQLGIRTVRDRLYRGYCQSMEEFEAAFKLFNSLKDDIYKVYTDCPYIDEKYKKSTVKYLDDFYKVINNPKTAEREFRAPCNQKQDVVITGYENQ